MTKNRKFTIGITVVLALVFIGVVGWYMVLRAYRDAMLAPDVYDRLVSTARKGLQEIDADLPPLPYDARIDLFGLRAEELASAPTVDGFQLTRVFVHDYERLVGVEGAGFMMKIYCRGVQGDSKPRVARVATKAYRLSNFLIMPVHTNLRVAGAQRNPRIAGWSKPDLERLVFYPASMKMEGFSEATWVHAEPAPLHVLHQFFEGRWVVSSFVWEAGAVLDGAVVFAHTPDGVLEFDADPVRQPNGRLLTWLGAWPAVGDLSSDKSAHRSSDYPLPRWDQPRISID